MAIKCQCYTHTIHVWNSMSQHKKHITIKTEKNERKANRTEQNRTKQAKKIRALSYRIYDMKFIHFILFSSCVQHNTIGVYLHNSRVWHSYILLLVLRKINSIFWGGREWNGNDEWDTFLCTSETYTQTHTHIQILTK